MNWCYCAYSCHGNIIFILNVKTKRPIDRRAQKDFYAENRMEKPHLKTKTVTKCLKKYGTLIISIASHANYLENRSPQKLEVVSANTIY